MRFLDWMFTGVFILALVSCGGSDQIPQAPAVPAAAANDKPAVIPPEVIEITSVEQFDQEVAKARTNGVVIADFHAEWCGPCKKLAPELVALVLANPGKLYVLKVDIDQHPQLAERVRVESIPLLVKFTDGKESERKVGYQSKAALAEWLGIK